MLQRRPISTVRTGPGVLPPSLRPCSRLGLAESGLHLVSMGQKVWPSFLSVDVNGNEASAE